VGEAAPEVVIADGQRPAAAWLGYDEEFNCLWVALEDPPQIKVSGSVYDAFARELADFFADLARCPPVRGEPRRVSSCDEELCVEAWSGGPGLVRLAVSLASDMWDPHWAVRVNLSVALGDLPRIAAAIERLARYADGLPPSGDAGPGAAADGGGM
jgi:hypothetical protein